MSTLQPEIGRALALVELTDPSAGSIASVLEAWGERDVVLAAADVVAIAAVVADLRAVLATTERDIAAARLNDLLARHAGPPRLVRHEGWSWHLHVDRGDDAPWDGWLASSAALALAALLVAGADEDAAGVPWGLCAADGCARPFVHDGRGGPRRWCSSTCATRERVRRHRASRRARPDRDGRDALSARRTPRARPARGGASATG